MADKVRVGVIGCGEISGAYLGMAKNFPIVEIAACADLNLDAAKQKAAEYGIPKVCTVDEIIDDPSIQRDPEPHRAQGARADRHGARWKRASTPTPRSRWASIAKKPRR